MKKGLAVALLLVTFAWFSAQNATAVSPIVGDPGDFIIGGTEADDGGSTGTWVFVNAFDLRDQALDDVLDPDQLIFSFTGVDDAGDETTIFTINGVGPLNPDGIGFFEDEPTSPNSANVLNGATLDEADDTGSSPFYNAGVAPTGAPTASDDTGWTVTIRNTGISPEGGPNVSQAVLDSMDVDAEGNFTTNTVTVSLFASDGASFGSSSFVVFSSAAGPDSGGLFTLEDPGPTDFADSGNPPGDDAWIPLDFGAVLSSSAGTDVTSGLCIFVNLTGENIGQWDMPRGNAIELTKNKVYRIRFAVSTDQNNAGAQPVWNVLMSNLDSATGRIIYGAERWWFDNTDGANGIGVINRAGLNEVDAYLTPNAFQTDAWNGVGAADNPNSPFDDSALNADNAAFQVSFRVLDLDSAGLLAELDSGTTCLRNVTIQSIDRGSLTPVATVFGSASAVPDAIAVDTSFSPDAIVSDNGSSIAISLDEQPPAVEGLPGIGRAFVAFLDESEPVVIPGVVGVDPNAGQVNFLRDFPIVWNDNELLCLEAEIRATGGTSDKPVDVIATGWQAATNEIGGTDFMFRGQPGDVMDKAGSPRATGNSTYTSYFWTHHQTNVNQALLADSQRLRAILDFFNRTDLVVQEAGDGILSDQFTITSFQVTRINTSAIDSPAD